MTYSLNTLTDTRAATSSPRAGVGRFAHEIALVLGLVALVFWLLALASYSAQDPAFSTSGSGAAVRNWGGRLRRLAGRRAVISCSGFPSGGASRRP